jgi:hypothetical protein
MGPCRCVQRCAGSDHRFREQHFGRVEPLAYLGQHFTPSHQWFLEQALARVIKYVEQDVPHRTPVRCLANPPNVGKAVPAQQPRQVGPGVSVAGHQFPVNQRPRRQAAEEFQFRVLAWLFS